MTSVHRELPLVFAIFAVALVARLLFLGFAGPLRSTDSPEYEAIGHNLAEGHGFSLRTSAPFIPTVRRPPVYPLFLALLGGSSATHAARVAIVQIILDSAVAAAIILLTAGVPMRGARIGAAVLYALHPAAVAASTTLLTETLFTFLLMVAALLAIAARKRDRVRLSILAGAVIGLAILCRPLGVIYAAGVVLVMLASRKQPRPSVHAAAFLISCVLIVAPWTIRCSLVTGRFVLMQATGVCNGYLPTRWDWDQNDQAALWRKFEGDPYGKRLNAARTDTEVIDLNTFGREQGIRNIKANPRAYLLSRIRTYPHLFISTFGGRVGTDETLGQAWSRRRYGAAVLLAVMLIVFSLLPLVAAACAIPRVRYDPSIALCAMFITTTLLVHIPMWIEYRYWLPVLPYELALAAAGAESIVRSRKRTSEAAY